MKRNPCLIKLLNRSGDGGAFFRRSSTSNALWGLVSGLSLAFRPLSVQTRHSTSAGDVYCGTTIAEALSLGCLYDPLSSAWLPPYCRDDELTDEFNRAGPGADGAWAYYADEQGTRPLALPEVAALGNHLERFWVSRDWHIVHCLFYWRKHVRMRETNAVMEARYDKMHHVEHCQRFIRNPTPDHFFLIEVPVQLNSSDSF